MQAIKLGKICSLRILNRCSPSFLTVWLAELLRLLALNLKMFPFSAKIWWVLTMYFTSFLWLFTDTWAPHLLSAINWDWQVCGCCCWPALGGSCHQVIRFNKGVGSASANQAAAYWCAGAAIDRSVGVWVLLLAGWAVVAISKQTVLLLASWQASWPASWPPAATTES